MDAATTLILLLPERRRFADRQLSPEFGRWLARSDRLDDGEPGELEQLQRHFRPRPAGWPMAAIQRQADFHDADGHRWLRADPVHVRPDMAGARLLAWGNLDLAEDEAADLLKALAPLFGDAGMPLTASSPDRWYLQLPRDSVVPAFSAPAQALGDDVFRHLPEGAEGRRWRALLNEAQILLHNHPRNVQRQATGRPAVNSVWFWGGGLLPDAVAADAAAVCSDDAELLALAALAGLTVTDTMQGATLVDLRRARDWRGLERDVLAGAIDGLGRGHAAVLLDFADGGRWRVERRHRWRLWRRPLLRLDA